MEKLVIFYYDKGSRAKVVIESLANHSHFKRYLQCDDFAGYETAFKINPDVQLLNYLCISGVILNRLWMEIRRWQNMVCPRYSIYIGLSTVAIGQASRMTNERRNARNWPDLSWMLESVDGNERYQASLILRPEKSSRIPIPDGTT